VAPAIASVDANVPCVGKKSSIFPLTEKLIDQIGNALLTSTARAVMQSKQFDEDTNFQN